MNLKRLTKEEVDAIAARLGPRCIDGEMVQCRLEREHPALFAEVDAMVRRYSANLITFSQLTYYCLRRGVPALEIVPLFDRVGDQAGAQYAAVIMQMADEWQKEPILDRILKG